MSPLSVELSSSEFSKENLKNCSFVIGFRKFRKNLNSSIILFLRPVPHFKKNLKLSP